MTQAPPPTTPYGVPLSIDAARKAMAAAEADAMRNNLGVSIAIVDSGGNLVMLHRLDNAQLSSVRIAEAKGTTLEEEVRQWLNDFGAGRWKPTPSEPKKRQSRKSAKG